MHNHTWLWHSVLMMFILLSKFDSLHKEIWFLITNFYIFKCIHFHVCGCTRAGTYVWRPESNFPCLLLECFLPPLKQGLPLAWCSAGGQGWLVSKPETSCCGLPSTTAITTRIRTNARLRIFRTVLEVNSGPHAWLTHPLSLKLSGVNVSDLKFPRLS